jgi:hypothetical protein
MTVHTTLGEDLKCKTADRWVLSKLTQDHKISYFNMFDKRLFMPYHHG